MPIRYATYQPLKALLYREFPSSPELLVGLLPGAVQRSAQFIAWSALLLEPTDPGNLSVIGAQPTMIHPGLIPASHQALAGIVSELTILQVRLAITQQS